VGDGDAEIWSRVAVAMKEREYSLGKESVLMRRKGANGPTDRLVNGGWVLTFRWRLFRRPAWRSLDPNGLREHMWGYLVSDLDSTAFSWRHPWTRVSRSRLWRWIVPPLAGGATAHLPREAFERSQSIYTDQLSGPAAEDMAELREEALRGYQKQADRCTAIEQRANFFLGAAGLTTSLVLGNAGLLIGTGKLHAPWLGLAMGALSVASVCAIAAGFRALQAAMYTFGRAAPNGPNELIRRGKLRGDELIRAYAGALLAAQDREAIVSDWKVARVKTARRLFLGVIAGVVLLTAFVLLEAA
jgi:hypothetical protein